MGVLILEDFSKSSGHPLDSMGFHWIRVVLNDCTVMAMVNAMVGKLGNMRHISLNHGDLKRC